MNRSRNADSGIESDRSVVSGRRVSTRNLPRRARWRSRQSRNDSRVAREAVDRRRQKMLSRAPSRFVVKEGGQVDHGALRRGDGKSADALDIRATDVETMADNSPTLRGPPIGRHRDVNGPRTLQMVGQRDRPQLGGRDVREERMPGHPGRVCRGDRGCAIEGSGGSTHSPERAYQVSSGESAGPDAQLERRCHGEHVAQRVGKRDARGHDHHTARVLPPGLGVIHRGEVRQSPDTGA